MSGETSASFIVITVILTSIVLGTIIGNFFVISAILVDKNLQTTANQLVLSLAISDLMVACLVMPLGAYNDIYQGWYLSKEMCEFWTSADVLCCTASILNLLAIALDRYWAVTNVDYIYRRTRQRVNMMILCAWAVGAGVSLAPIFGWKDPDFANRVLQEHKCLVSQDVGYQVFATVSSFYAPLVLLLALYWRIFQVARKRIRTKPGRQEAIQRHTRKEEQLQLQQQQHQQQSCQVMGNKQVNLAPAINYLPETATGSAATKKELETSLHNMTTSSSSSSNSNSKMLKTRDTNDKDFQQSPLAAPPGAQVTHSLDAHSAQFNSQPEEVSSVGRKEELDAGALLLTSCCETTAERIESEEQHTSPSNLVGHKQQHRNWYLEAAPATVRWRRPKEQQQQQRQRESPLAISLVVAEVPSKKLTGTADCCLTLQVGSTCRQSNCSDSPMIERSGKGAAAAASKATMKRAASKSMCNFKRNLRPTSSGSSTTTSNHLLKSDWMQLLQMSSRISPSKSCSSNNETTVTCNPTGDSDSSSWCCCCCCRQCAQVQVHTSDLESGICVHCGVGAGDSQLTLSSSVSSSSFAAGGRRRQEQQQQQQRQRLKWYQPGPQINHPDQRNSAVAYNSDESRILSQLLPLPLPSSQMKELRQFTSNTKSMVATSRRLELSSEDKRNIDKAERKVAPFDDNSTSTANTFHTTTTTTASDENSNSALATATTTTTPLTCLPQVADHSLDDEDDGDDYTNTAVTAVHERKLSLTGCLHLSVSQQRIGTNSQRCNLHQHRRRSSSCSTSDVSIGTCLASGCLAIHTCQVATAAAAAAGKLTLSRSSASDLNSASTSTLADQNSDHDDDDDDDDGEVEDEDDAEDEDEELDVASLSASFPPPIELLDQRQQNNRQHRTAEENNVDSTVTSSTMQPTQPQTTTDDHVNPVEGLARSVLPMPTLSLMGDNKSTVAVELQQQQQHRQHEQQQPSKKCRSLDIRRKFRVIGQLVSFVQTSANLRNSSSSHLQYTSSSTASQSEETPHMTASPADCGSAGTAQVFSLSATVCTNSNSAAAAAAAAVSTSNLTEYHHHDKLPRGLARVVSSTANSSSAKASCKSNNTTTTTTTATTVHMTAVKSTRQQQQLQQRRRHNMDIKREKKAAKTLAIITGVFVCCWLPFFLNAIVMPICGQTCTPSDLVLSILLWLGYLNSLLNPIIYTIFSPDFRRAFRRLLCLPRLVQLGGKLKQQQQQQQQQQDCSAHTPLESIKK